MINFSGLSRESVLGRLARIPLRLVPRNLVVPVLQGPLAGKRWIVGSSTHGCWLGSYESEMQEVFSRVVSEGQMVFDVGSNVGFHTLLASVLVGDSGQVVAFEPLPENLVYLERHLKLNGVRNVKLVAAAVSSATGVAMFEAGANRSTGHLAEAEKGMEVKTVSLDDLVLLGQIEIPDCMKVDVEGAELQVLHGAEKILAGSRPTVLLATHGEQLHSGCCNFLRELGYDVTGLNGGAPQDCSEVLAVAK